MNLPDCFRLTQSEKMKQLFIQWVQAADQSDTGVIPINVRRIHAETRWSRTTIYKAIRWLERNNLLVQVKKSNGYFPSEYLVRWSFQHPGLKARKKAVNAPRPKMKNGTSPTLEEERPRSYVQRSPQHSTSAQSSPEDFACCPATSHLKNSPSTANPETQTPPCYSNLACSPPGQKPATKKQQKKLFNPVEDFAYVDSVLAKNNRDKIPPNPNKSLRWAMHRFRTALAKYHPDMPKARSKRLLNALGYHLKMQLALGHVKPGPKLGFLVDALSNALQRIPNESFNWSKWSRKAIYAYLHGQSIRIPSARKPFCTYEDIPQKHEDKLSPTAQAIIRNFIMQHPEKYARY